MESLIKLNTCRAIVTFEEHYPEAEHLWNLTNKGNVSKDSALKTAVYKSAIKVIRIEFIKESNNILAINEEDWKILNHQILWHQKTHSPNYLYWEEYLTINPYTNE